MNTISFIKSLLVASIAPQVLLNSSFKWKAPTKENPLWMFNPEWEDAPYELQFISGILSYVGPVREQVSKSPFPTKRFKIGKEGLFELVEPIIYKRHQPIDISCHK